MNGLPCVTARADISSVVWCEWTLQFSSICSSLYSSIVIVSYARIIVKLSWKVLHSQWMLAIRGHCSWKPSMIVTPYYTVIRLIWKCRVVLCCHHLVWDTVWSITLLCVLSWNAFRVLWFADWLAVLKATVSRPRTSIAAGSLSTDCWSVLIAQFGDVPNTC